jgi:hypothetical protein
MTLTAEEFLRRFLLHVLPRGFMRIRHYGLLANRHREPQLARCRALLGVTAPPSHPADLDHPGRQHEDAADRPSEPTPTPSACPVCGQPMRVVEIIAPLSHDTS